MTIIVKQGRATAIAARVEAFVREIVVPYEKDCPLGAHGPSEALVVELPGKSRAAGVLPPRILSFMTEPATDGGAGSDPSMMQTTCVLDGNHWLINGRERKHSAAAHDDRRESIDEFQGSPPYHGPHRHIRPAEARIAYRARA